jgi:hypothetical protein
VADANESRDWRIYADLAQRLIAQARKLYATDAELAKHARKPGSLADQTASRDGYAPLIDRWDNERIDLAHIVPCALLTLHPSKELTC